MLIGMTRGGNKSSHIKQTAHASSTMCGSENNNSQEGEEHSPGFWPKTRLFKGRLVEYINRSGPGENLTKTSPIKGGASVKNTQLTWFPPQGGGRKKEKVRPLYRAKKKSNVGARKSEVEQTQLQPMMPERADIKRNHETRWRSPNRSG